MVTSSFCNGFVNCDPIKTPKCEVGSLTTTRFNDKYKPGTPIALVERYSGGKLGIAIVNENVGLNNVCLSLSKQEEIFHATYNGLATSFVFNVKYKIYNVKKIVLTSSIEYELLKDNEELYIGPDNLIAIVMEWTRADGVILNGYLTYSTETTSQIQLWDGTVGAIQATNLEKVTDPNLLWYAYHQNDRKKPNGVYNGSYLAFQSFGRVRSVQNESLNPLDPYVGGIMQKDNTSTFDASSDKKSCVDLTNDHKIAFLITGQNNIIHQSVNSFGQGHIDFCDEADCGNCSLVYFQITTPNGCIEGDNGLNTAQIISIIIGIIGFFLIVILIAQYFILKRS